MRATLIFDKCHGEFYSVPMFSLKALSISKEARSEIAAAVGFYTTKCPTQSIFDRCSRNGEVFMRDPGINLYIVLFFFITQYRSCHYTSLALVQLPIFQFSSLYFLLWMTNCQLSGFYFLLRRMSYFRQCSIPHTFSLPSLSNMLSISKKYFFTQHLFITKCIIY